MIHSLLKAAATCSATSPPSLNAAAKISATVIPLTGSAANQILRRFSAKASKSTLSKAKKKSQTVSKSDEHPGGSSADVDADLDGERIRLQKLAEDEKNKALDIGPNERPLFTSASSLTELSRKDTCSYMKFSMDDLNAVLPEGLPAGMLKEFDVSKRSALLVRQSFLDLRDNFRRIVDPPVWPSSAKATKVRKQIVLDGPRSCGKSITISMLVHWARDEGWLKLVNGRMGGFTIKIHKQEFCLFNETKLKQLPCQTYNEPIPLGEGAGVGWYKGADTMVMPDESSLYDLVMAGVNNTHASVGVLVRLRKELSLVKDVPVLIAVDQYNSWFTFSEYEEPATVRSCKPIHARDLSTVNAFRPMMHDDMMVGAFSHSTAVGKLRQELPGVPIDARVNFPRYDLDEAAAVSHYYLRQRLIRRESFTDEKWKKAYYLSNGNGTEMRWLAPLIW
ncbi:hypothetical protein V2J09_016400 [Rumex salicifolius]